MKEETRTPRLISASPPLVSLVMGAILLSACVAQSQPSMPLEETTLTQISPSTTSTTAARPPVVTSTLPSMPVPSPRNAAGNTVQIVRVLDGDTIVVHIDGVEDRVRLIGINAPESGECIVDEATTMLTTILDGRSVTLLGDVNDRDQYGRLLRYVYVGEVFVNEQLVEAGVAFAHRYEPDTAMAEVLEAAQLRAQQAAVGMWAPDACGPAVEADVVVESIRYDADGNDNENLNDEWVLIVNRTMEAVSIGGWTLKDESASHRFVFPSGFTLRAGDKVTVHTGCGQDSRQHLYWCESGSAVWNNSGDTAFLLDLAGNIVATHHYE